MIHHRPIQAATALCLLLLVSAGTGCRVAERHTGCFCHKLGMGYSRVATTAYYPCYGYQPTCWSPWPGPCVGCPPPEQILPDISRKEVPENPPSPPQSFPSNPPPPTPGLAPTPAPAPEPEPAPTPAPKPTPAPAPTPAPEPAPTPALPEADTPEADEPEADEPEANEPEAPAPADAEGDVPEQPAPAQAETTEIRVFSPAPLAFEPAREEPGELFPEPLDDTIDVLDELEEPRSEPLPAPALPEFFEDAEPIEEIHPTVSPAPEPEDAERPSTLRFKTTPSSRSGGEEESRVRLVLLMAR